MQQKFRPSVRTAIVLITVAAGLGAEVASAATAPCRNTGNFEAWLQGFRREAATAGITQRTLAAALDGMTLDQGVINIDRGQGFFAQSFLDFQAKLATPNRIQSGRQAVTKYQAYFTRAEKEFGVPAAVIAAFWALESDFGTGMGNRPVLRSLTALAYDCRRGEMFRKELTEALRIIDKGDLKPAEMIGSWAGELGQTQFLPSHYNTFGIDYDGDGRRDLLHSPADVIGSTARFLQSLGWQRGQPWLEEVRVPEKMAWEQADLEVKLPRSTWASRGVTRADGQPLTSDTLPASLLLLMGHDGPAFLAYPNFSAFTEWNKSLNYATTAAYLAARIAGAPAMGRGRHPVATLDINAMKELQQLLARQGQDIGEIDGRLGLATRKAVRAAQLKLGLPADSYPTAELIGRLRPAAR